MANIVNNIFQDSNGLTSHPSTQVQPPFIAQCFWVTCYRWFKQSALPWDLPSPSAHAMILFLSNIQNSIPACWSSLLFACDSGLFQWSRNYLRRLELMSNGCSLFFPEPQGNPLIALNRSGSSLSTFILPPGLSRHSTFATGARSFLISSWN